MDIATNTLMPATWHILYEKQPSRHSDACTSFAGLTGETGGTGANGLTGMLLCLPHAHLLACCQTIVTLIAAQ